MTTEWVEHLETSVPELVGFGRLVDYRNAYWHQMDETSNVDGTELVKLVGESLRVAGMYKMNSGRMKLETRNNTVYVATSGSSLLCALLPSSAEVDEEFAWDAITRSLELLNQFLEGATED